MSIDKFIYLGILVILGVFFIIKMFNPPFGPQYNLKTISFADKKLPKTTDLGKHIFISKAKSKLILPWEFDLWTQADLFENAIVLKRYKKEKVIFFYKLNAIEPMLINSLFTKDKYFGYQLKGKDGNTTILKSSNLCDLDIFIGKLCSLFQQ
nr:hypothetical protein [Treponema denticola]